MAILTTGTLMELTGITLPNYSARSLTFAAQPIDPGALEYDANGTLHDLTMTQFRKYQFTITCTDMLAPVLDDIWKGQPVSVTIVPHTGLGDPEAAQETFSCRLVSWSTSVDEWGARTGWSLTLLQV
jgi:hypothetical protein